MYIIVICTVLVSTLAFMYTCQALINKINTHTHTNTHMTQKHRYPTAYIFLLKWTNKLLYHVHKKHFAIMTPSIEK